MAYDIVLDPDDNSLVLTDTGDLKWFDDAGRVAQQIKIHLNTLLGEWLEDTNHGIGYFEYILIKGYRASTIQAYLISKIASIPDVKSVDSLELEIDKQARTLTVNYTATTTLGALSDTVKLHAAN